MLKRSLFQHSGNPTKSFENDLKAIARGAQAIAGGSPKRGAHSVNPKFSREWTSLSRTRSIKGIDPDEPDLTREELEQKEADKIMCKLESCINNPFSDV